MRFLALACLFACSAPAGKRRETTTKPEQCFYDCGPEQAQAAPAAGSPAAPAPAPGSKPAPGGKLTPAGEKAALMRQAADLLDKAGAALADGNKNLADSLFSSAELLVGPDALASIAPQFREGAPPRITTPTIKVETGVPAQPRAVGSSEDEDIADKVPPPPKVEVGTLTGNVQIDGKPLKGSYGLVTLEPVTGKWKPRTVKRHVMAQRNREFNPHVMAISVGSTVAFPNFDGIFHNVFSTSPLGAFDLGIYKTGEAREFTFQKEGIIRLGCNLHANMTGYLLVVAAPAYVVTDDQGRFKFGRLAPGKYKLKAWSERTNTPITQDITIKPGANSVNVGVAADAPSGPSPDKFGGKRG